MDWRVVSSGCPKLALVGQLMRPLPKKSKIARYRIGGEVWDSQGITYCEVDRPLANADVRSEPVKAARCGMDATFDVALGFSLV